MQIHSQFANAVGIDLKIQGQMSKIATASGGTTVITEVSDVEIEVEGSRAKVRCLFGSNSIPVLGRTTLLKFIDFGFDVNGWLLKW